MIVIPGETVVFVDCDDSLQMWSPSVEQLAIYGVDIVNPKTGEIEKIVPMRENIEQLKKHTLRGNNIIVWTAAGVPWAVALVKTLGLEKYVTACVSKPKWLIDDKLPAEFMPIPYWSNKL